MTAISAGPGTPLPPPRRPDRSADLTRPARPARPVVTEVRLTAFGPHRHAVFPLAPLTLFTGAAGSGKSHILGAYEALARLASGEPLRDVFPDPGACVPEQAGPDTQGRRGFRIGCTVDG
ncbi:MAG TPA: ATP-binding protein, partial [Streptomyces sp.]